MGRKEGLREGKSEHGQKERKNGKPVKREEKRGEASPTGKTDERVNSTQDDKRR
jgi:hypothetical protein